MTDLPARVKPGTIAHAELALWAWTAWTCLFGFYQTRGQIPEIEQVMSMQDIITVAPAEMLRLTAIGYGVLAVISAWVIMRIGAGKTWARSSLMWGFLFQLLFTACPPYETADLLAAIPDLGLQLYAIYLLYTKPGAEWFRHKTSATNG